MDKYDIYSQSVRHFLSPVLSLLDNPEVSEIMINGPKTIYYEQAGKLYLSECQFESEQQLQACATNIAEYGNRRLDGMHHSMDTRLPDGSRVHVIIPPASRTGTCVCIRKFMKSIFDLDRLVENKTITAEAVALLRTAVILKKNILISGGTGSGKTSLLNATSKAIPDDERVVVIEDSSELQLNQPHTVYLEAQQEDPKKRQAVSIRDLFVDSLRMRPDRIIVGEIRRGEALDLVQSMLSGHSGSLSTVHANTPRDSLVRLETLCLMSDVSMPIYVARSQVASAIDMVVQISRLASGNRRIMEISECFGLDDRQNYLMEPIFKRQLTAGKIERPLEFTGRAPSFVPEMDGDELNGYLEKYPHIFHGST